MQSDKRHRQSAAVEDVAGNLRGQYDKTAQVSSGHGLAINVFDERPGLQFIVAQGALSREGQAQRREIGRSDDEAARSNKTVGGVQSEIIGGQGTEVHE